MKELFFMVVAFVMPNTGAIDRPIFVYYKPYFETYAQCYQYVNEHNQEIYARAIEKMGKQHVPEAIYCITGEQVKSMNDYYYNQGEKKRI